MIWEKKSDTFLLRTQLDVITWFIVVLCCCSTWWRSISGLTFREVFFVLLHTCCCKHPHLSLWIDDGRSGISIEPGQIGMDLYPIHWWSVELRCHIQRFVAFPARFHSSLSDKNNVRTCNVMFIINNNNYHYYEQSIYPTGNLVPSMQSILLAHPFIWAVYSRQTAALITPKSNY